MKGEKMRCTRPRVVQLVFPPPLSVSVFFFTSLSLPLSLSLSLSLSLLSVRSVRASERASSRSLLLSSPTGNSTHRSQHCSQGKGHSCIFHVMNEPRMHRCSSTAMPPVISFFLARSFYLFVSARLDENAKCRTKHASSGVPGRREGGGGGGGGGEKKKRKKKKIANARRDLYFADEFVINFYFFPSFLFLFSLPLFLSPLHFPFRN